MASRYEVPLIEMDDVLVAPLQVELDDEGVARLGRQLLNRIRGDRPRGLLIDVSVRRILGLADFDRIRRIARQSELMGLPNVIVGMGPAAASGLADADVELNGLRFGSDVGDGMRILSRESADAPEESPIDQLDPELDPPPAQAELASDEVGG